MSIAIEGTSLEELVAQYFADTDLQASNREGDEQRAQRLPTLHTLTRQFVQGDLNLSAFRDKLQFDLGRNHNLWGTRGPGFMMELNKLRKNHDEQQPIAENELRAVLTGISKDNLGERIERFYNFLNRERARLRQAGKSPQQAMAPGNTAFMLSLFTYWLNPEHPLVIYYFKTCLVIARLIDLHLLSDPGGLYRPYDSVSRTNTILVRNNKEHQAFQEALHALSQASSVFQNDSRQLQHFLIWLIPGDSQSEAPEPTIIKEVDANADILTGTPSTTVRENGPDYQSGSSAEGSSTGKLHSFMPQQAHNEPLDVTPEPLLTRLIHEVQRHILVDEAIIRRIYHALLAGHVILTGPPGTGKTELARRIPETLWKSEINATAQDAQETEVLDEPELSTQTAYTTRLVTATDEWSVRTLISGIAPQSKDGGISYQIQYGYLTTTILKNWSFQENRPEEWSTLALNRTAITAQSGIERGTLLPFRGQWLVIDEFNRAPIDLALGDALTALGGNEMLRVAVEGGSVELPIPQDFRIIGTLNSFDRSYLNQISEALKRRFSFIEILPPARPQRAAEQGIVLYKAFKRIGYLSKRLPDAISVEDDVIEWPGVLEIEADSISGTYTITWLDEQTALREVFEVGWRLFEVIRIYRQLGTAQAISLIRHMLIAGILQGYNTYDAWIEALDVALCDTLADQLQVLLPDEIETLLLYLTTERDDFERAYNNLLSELVSTSHRLYGQLLALGSISDDHGQPFLTDEEIEKIVAQGQPRIPKDTLTSLFHLEQPLCRLPQFTRRLRTFKAERGL
jgi:MoxR-like ATPase